MWCACYVLSVFCFQRLNPLPHHHKHFPSMSHLAPSPSAATSPDLTHLYDAVTSRSSSHQSPPPPASNRALHDADVVTSRARTAVAATPRDLHERAAELTLTSPTHGARHKTSPAQVDSGREYIPKQLRKSGPRRLHVDLKGMKGTAV